MYFLEPMHRFLASRPSKPEAGLLGAPVARNDTTEGGAYDRKE